MHLPTIRLIAVLCMIALPAACGERKEGDLPPAAVVRDSAGIAIVENDGGGWGDGGGWTVDDEASLEIGVTEGEAVYQLDHVRAALRLGDGRIVVANGGSDELRAYDARGRHLASAGGTGSGPGEFRVISEVRRLPGDSLLAYDGTTGRISFFGPDLRFARSTELAGAEESWSVFADRLEDGSLLLTRSVRRWSLGSIEGTVRDTVAWLRRDLATGRTDSLLLSPADERRLDLRPGANGTMTVGMFTPPFLRGVEAAEGRGGWWHGVTERYELVLRRPDGTPARIVRRPHAPVPVRGAYLDSLRRVQAAEARAAGRSAGGADPLDRVELPESLPAFSRLLVDDDGNLWVELFPWPGRLVRPRWEVFNPEGRLLGGVDLPAGLRATHVGRDFVLGVWKDEADVEYVRLHALRKR